MTDVLYKACISNDIKTIREVQESLRNSPQLQKNVDYAVYMLTSRNYTNSEKCTITHARNAKYAIEMTTSPETLMRISLTSQAAVEAILRSGVHFDTLNVLPLPKLNRKLIKRLVYAGTKFAGFPIPTTFNFRDFSLYPNLIQQQIYTLMLISQKNFYLPIEVYSIIFSHLVT